MSKMISEQENSWGKKSWINNFVNDKAVIANLTEEYANDVLESIADDTFTSLDAAIADLSLRTGLTASEVSDVKRVCVAMVKKAEEAPAACNVCKEDEVPGNKDVPGARLVKESPEAVAKVTLKEKIAKGMNPGFQAYLDKKKEEKEGKKSEEGTDKKEDKTEEASAKADKTAWFQGSDEKVDAVVSNDPNQIGGPGNMSYPKKPMETTAPGGEDSRPFEQKHFEESAKETKKVMGPKGTEFDLKVEMQRIPEGEKVANASSKRLALVKEIVASEKKA